ncbi:uncharacterized protein LOC133721001 isoform X3 [Rosa rugosa]|uniref:uncharacterized protein LOC133721001 isoform X3 n=1 Tax=Rosa rugosa TaxID=74645 RepID=UPI002B40EBDD|nr:uncharacterized protein LOC133721001 isoform X3 [Rosa rugosa]
MLIWCLIPNSNKTDKASMLDEAVEYLKQLQLQVQRGERKKQKKGETGRTEEAGKSKRREELLYFTDSRCDKPGHILLSGYDFW